MAHAFASPKYARTPRVVAVSALVLALALPGCATTGAGTASAQKGAEHEKAAAEALKLNEAEVKSLIKNDPIAAAAYWGSVYDANPKDGAAAAAYGDALRQIGSVDKAIQVLEDAALRNPDDARVLAAYGKTLATTGQAREAANVLERATTIDPKNWQALSASGVVQDQLGNHEAARSRYEAALAVNPNSAQILNNYGLSCALGGDLNEAESLLRRAIGLPEATAQVRQNLALVLGLAGKFDEAERIAGRDLRPKDAINNMDYIRGLLGQPAGWNDTNALDQDRTGQRKPATDAPQTVATP